MSSSVAFSGVFVVLLIAVLIPFAIVLYVYRDAKRRGMNAVLWALVAAFAPGLIGLIVYLLVRGNYSNLRCPACEQPVKEEYVVCPKCGTKLRTSCPNCGMPVEADWKVCPRCTESLANILLDVQVPVRAKDRSIWKVLVIILIVPVLLILILVLSSSAYSGGSATFYGVSTEEYFEEMNEEGSASEQMAAAHVKEWLDLLQTRADHAYALRYDHATEAGTEYFFLIFVPEAGMNSGVGQSNSIFGTTLSVEFQRTGSGYYLFQIASSGEREPNLKIKLDGKKIPCDVMEVDYNPTLFFLVPQQNEVTL